MFTKNIAKALFLSLEVGNVLIDPREALKLGPRVAAEPVRTELYQKAVRVALGPISSEELYRHTLKLGNQNSVDHLNPQKRKKLNDCVDPPTTLFPVAKKTVIAVLLEQEKKSGPIDTYFHETFLSVN